MRMDCDIIKDLMPLYAEDMVSDKSKEALEEHFNECEKCKSTFQAMKNPEPKTNFNKEPAKSFKKYVKKKKMKLGVKIALITAACLMLAVIIRLVAIGGLIGFLALDSLTAKIYQDTDVANYEQYMGPNAEEEYVNKWGMDESIFPASITEQMGVKEYKMVYYNPWDAQYLSYLTVEYSDEDYAKELERLAKCPMDQYVGYYGATGFEEKYTLSNIENHRNTQKKQRVANGLKRVSLVGYTNAGKSTVMNALLESTYVQDDETIQDKQVFEKDMLFATLDTTVRRIAPKDGFEFLLSDTVGFVSNLPHSLVSAFRSTLQEVLEADLLIHVVDMSDLNHEEQISITKDVLLELEAGAIPVIYIYNKADLCFPVDSLPKVTENKIYMSAKQRIGMDALIDMIQKNLSEKYVDCVMLIPYAEGGILNYLREHAKVEEVEYAEEGSKVRLQVSIHDYNKCIRYVINPVIKSIDEEK